MIGGLTLDFVVFIWNVEFISAHVIRNTKPITYIIIEYYSWIA